MGFNHEDFERIEQERVLPEVDMVYYKCRTCWYEFTDAAD